MNGPETKSRGPGISPFSIFLLMMIESSSWAPRSRTVVTPLIKSCLAAIGMISLAKRDM
jgi:hypothetical protein